MDIRALLFSYQGRIGRQAFWLGSLGLTAVAAVLIVLVNGSFAGLGVVLLLIDLAMACAWGLMISAIAVKRAHDRDRAWWFALIPGLNIIELGFRDGAEGSNRYGPSPKAVARAAAAG